MTKTYVKRKKYLDKITPYINKDVIKVIAGQRRVGKSYMFYQIMDLLKSNNIPKEQIIYVNKELHDFDDVKTNKDLISYVSQNKKTKGKHYVFIDEVQEIESFEKSLRSLQASGGYDIYCTGSNAKMLSGELATQLSGRYIETKMYSLTYPEFLTFHRLERSGEAFTKYIKYGGLPYLIHLELDDEIVYDYLKGIYNTILFKDVVEKNNVRNVNFLERLVEYIADNTGSIVSAKKISDFLKSQRIRMSPNIIINYLTYLTQAFFIFKVSRSEVGGKRIFEVGEKYYFEDLGLWHSIIGFKQPDINKVLENIVYLHLLARNYKITVGKLHDKEIDFVCEKQGEKLYVQVAYLINNDKTVESEFGNLLKIKDNYRKVVVSMDETIGGKHEGIEHIKINDFLFE